MKRILIFIIPLFFFSCQRDKPIEISKKEFEENILIPGDLEKGASVSFIFFEGEIRLFIKPDRLHLPRHERVKNIKEGHHYFLPDNDENSNFYSEMIIKRRMELGLSEEYIPYSIGGEINLWYFWVPMILLLLASQIPLWIYLKNRKA